MSKWLLSSWSSLQIHLSSNFLDRLSDEQKCWIIVTNPPLLWLIQNKPHGHQSEFPRPSLLCIILAVPLLYLSTPEPPILIFIFLQAPVQQHWWKDQVLLKMNYDGLNIPYKARVTKKEITCPTLKILKFLSPFCTFVNSQNAAYWSH